MVKLGCSADMPPPVAPLSSRGSPRPSPRLGRGGTGSGSASITVTQMRAPPVKQEPTLNQESGSRQDEIFAKVDGFISLYLSVAESTSFLTPMSGGPAIFTQKFTHAEFQEGFVFPLQYAIMIHHVDNAESSLLTRVHASLVSSTIKIVLFKRSAMIPSLFNWISILRQMGLNFLSEMVSELRGLYGSGEFRAWRP